MKFREVPKDVINGLRVKGYGKLQRFINEFIEASIPVAEVEWEGHYSSPQSCVHALSVSAKRLNAFHVKVSISGDKVYIINKIFFE